MSILPVSGIRPAACAFVAAAFLATLGPVGAGNAFAAGDSGATATAETEGPDPTKSASNPLSDAGTSGFHLFRRNCQSCHGHLGAGLGKVPALSRTEYAQDHAARRAFHDRFRELEDVHKAVARGTRKRKGIRFNDLELIGKFLREIVAWHAMLEANDPDK